MKLDIHITKTSQRADTGCENTTALNAVGEPRDESEDHSAYGIGWDREELRPSVRYGRVYEGDQTVKIGYTGRTITEGGDDSRKKG